MWINDRQSFLPEELLSLLLPHLQWPMWPLSWHELRSIQIELIPEYFTLLLCHLPGHSLSLFLLHPVSDTHWKPCLIFLLHNFIKLMFPQILHALIHLSLHYGHTSISVLLLCSKLTAFFARLNTAVAHSFHSLTLFNLPSVFYAHLSISNQIHCYHDNLYFGVLKKNHRLFSLYYMNCFIQSPQSLMK